MVVSLDSWSVEDHALVVPDVVDDLVVVNSAVEVLETSCEPLESGVVVVLNVVIIALDRWSVQNDLLLVGDVVDHLVVVHQGIEVLKAGGEPLESSVVVVLDIVVVTLDCWSVENHLLLVSDVVDNFIVVDKGVERKKHLCFKL